ncbi:hypothetical protein YC2023_045691 [Brassica napus]
MTLPTTHTCKTYVRYYQSRKRNEIIPPEVKCIAEEYNTHDLCFKRRAPFAPRRKAHSGDSPIAMHLPGEGMVPKACAMVRF